MDDGRDGRLARLYERHASDAFRFAYAVCGGRLLAEDAVQEAFVRVAGRFQDLRSPAAFVVYLRRTIVNVLRSSVRSRDRDAGRIDAYARLQPAGIVPGADATVEGLDASEHLWLALGRLPARQRAAVVCRYWLDLSERDTARVIGCRPGTVKSLLSRSLASLREEISDG